MRKFTPLLMVAVVLALFACKEPVDPIVPENPVSASFSVQPASLSFQADGGSQTVTLTTDSKSWKTALTGDWATVAPSTGAGNKTVTITVPENEAGRRMLTLTFSDAAGLTGSASVNIVQEAKEHVSKDIVPAPAEFDGIKRSSTAYQLLIYSFADSDGDGIGDFKGIQNKLDYLDALGVTALWLSPAHPTSSYHAYEVNDYYAVNPLYGTEQDFKNLIDAAHAKGIKIYMDYILNHSGKDNAWFKEALVNPDSKYRDYYFFSSNPSKDYSSFPMLKGTSFISEEWRMSASGSPKLTITKTDEAVTNGTSDWNLWTWQDGAEAKTVRFTAKDDGTFYLIMEINGKLGLLVRKYMNWNAGSKFGAYGNGTVTEGKPMDLVAQGGDMFFTGSGRYKIELTNVSTETLYYMGCFNEAMPDLNYGDVSTAETNPCFLDIAASADKWIKMGVDGFRLDAVKHICGGIKSFNHSANRTLLKKWYEHCNATYQAEGHNDNIFMVVEEWDVHSTEKEYYQSLNSCFEFDYWNALQKALSGSASSFASTVVGYINDHLAQRPDAITSIFMTNHDQDRAAESLGRNVAKEKQAAAMMLTTEGKPFIYQGEELGYWGVKKPDDDRPVRTPIMWDKAGKECAKAGVENEVDNSMLTAAISVESQEADENSLLSVYKTWSRLRNTYRALGDGHMHTTTAVAGGGNSIAAWTMSFDWEEMLVIHNCAKSATTVSVAVSMDNPVALLGTASVKGNSLTLGPNSSVVFKIQ